MHVYNTLAFFSLIIACALAQDRIPDFRCGSDFNGATCPGLQCCTNEGWCTAKCFFVIVEDDPRDDNTPHTTIEANTAVASSGLGNPLATVVPIALPTITVNTKTIGGSAFVSPSNGTWTRPTGIFPPNSTLTTTIFIPETTVVGGNSNLTLLTTIYIPQATTTVFIPEATAVDGNKGGIVTLLTTIYFPQATGSGNGGRLTNGTSGGYDGAIATRTVTLTPPITTEVSGAEVLARVNILIGCLVAMIIGLMAVV